MKRILFFSVLTLFCLTISAQTYIPVTNPNPAILNYSFQDGSFESFGCAGLDPAFWFSENGISMTVNFVKPEQNPSVRVWGMNTDDTAQFMVNGEAYPLNTSTASYDPKVICNAIGSPGPDGVLFSNGLLAGSNTNNQGNYSYQNVTIIGDKINSITVIGLSGLGWGIGGVTVDNILAVYNNDLKAAVEVFPNPTNGNFTIDLGKEYSNITVEIVTILGQVISSEKFAFAEKIEQQVNTSAGMYFLNVSTAEGAFNSFKIFKN